MRSVSYTHLDVYKRQIQLWLDELSQDYVCSTMIYKEAFDHEYDTPKDWKKLIPKQDIIKFRMIRGDY